MQRKSVWAFLLLVLGSYQPFTWQAKSSTPRPAPEAAFRGPSAPIADPTDTPPAVGLAPPLALPAGHVTTAALAVSLVAFLLFCSVCAVRAARACPALCQTRPWFLPS